MRDPTCSRSKRHCPAFRPIIESLEERITPVLDPFPPTQLVPREVAKAVALVGDPGGSLGSGTLVYTGLNRYGDTVSWVLTANHVLNAIQAPPAASTCGSTGSFTTTASTPTTSTR